MNLRPYQHAISIRRGRTGKMLDQCAAWLPSGRWDDHRWHPVGARLVGVQP